MIPQPLPHPLLTPEQLRRMRTADRHWRSIADERAAMVVHEALQGHKVGSETPQGDAGRAL